MLRTSSDSGDSAVTADPGLALRKPVDGRLLVQLAQPGSLQGSPEQLVRWVGDDADPAAIGRAAAQLMEMAASAAELKVCNGP
jgi:hypothetical protein